jgi:PAS domain S-box-containing protein
MLRTVMQHLAPGRPRLARPGPLCAFIVGLSALAVAGTAAADPAPLRFLGNRNLAPVVYLEDGTPAGVAVELVRALAPHLSRPLEVRVMDWSAAQALVFRGDADALIQMNPTDERRRQYDFSQPLLESQFSIFVRRGSVGIRDATGLRGLSVGVEAGGLPEQLLSRDPAIRLVRITDFAAAFSLLAAYELDAVVVDWRVGSFVVARTGLRDVAVTGEPIATSRSAIAVKKGNTALLAEIDAALAAIRADGTYDRILERWRPKEVVLRTREQVARIVTWAVIAVLAGGLLSTGLWLLALRRESRRRRAVEDQLTARSAILAGIIDGADAVIFSMDRALRYTSFNARHASVMRSVFGVEIALGECPLGKMSAPTADPQGIRAALERALAGEPVVREAWSGVGAARRFFRAAYTPIRGAAGEVLGVAMMAQDLTERKQDEETIRRVNRELRALTSSNKTLLRATDERSLLQEVCRIVVEEAGYRMAWVGYAETDEARTVRPVAWAGAEDGYLGTAAITWADTDRGRGPTGTAIRTRRTACIQDFERDSSASPWREGALRRGYRSSAAFPLEDPEGRTFGALTIYSADAGAFTPHERRLLEELAADLSLGIGVLRARAELQRAERQRAAHLHFLESMDRVNRAIASAPDLEQMMSEVLDVVLAVFGCDRAFLVFPCDPGARAWSAPMERCRPEWPGLGALGSELPRDAQIAEKHRTLLDSDAPVAFGPGTPHPLPADIAERFGLRSMLSIAVRPKVGHAWEFGIHQCARVRAWTVDEEWLFQEIGRRLADALSTGLVVRDLRTSEARLANAERLVHVGSWECALAPSGAGGPGAQGGLLEPAGRRDDAPLSGRVDVSEEACRIFGLPPEQRAWTLDQWLARWRALAHPADADRADRAITGAIAQGRPAWDVEFRILRDGGEVRWIRGQGEILRDGQGRALRLAGTMQDVTDRKQADEALRRSEEQYRRIVETAHEGIWVLDAGGNTSFVNQQLAQMLRCTVEELRGAPVGDFCDAEDRDVFGADLARRRDAGAEQHELRLWRRDGSELWALVELTPFVDDDGVFTGALAMVTDVTERRAIEAQLRQSQKLEAVGRLAGGVAHDFNNLLTAILGDARVLAESLAPDDPLRTEATEIEAAARRAALLTRQLLAFGRKQRIEPRVVDVAQVIDAMDRMLRRLIGEDVQLATAVAPDLGRIRVDPVHLEQVLLNLAVNARDAMPDGGRLVIEAANVDDRGAHGAAGGRVMVAVRDTGHGMTPEVQAHLFEPFFTTKEAGKGTGLGLATVYGIVKQAGGDIRVRSAPGEGTSFEILFPRVDGPAEPAEAAPPRELPRGTETILVVEDEPLVRALAVRVLRDAGYEVLEASDAEEALERVAQGRVRLDLLLTDVVMPRGSGPDLARRLRANRPELPVLFASGYMDRAQDVQGQVGRWTGFIPKPFTADELARQIRELLGGGPAATREVDGRGADRTPEPAADAAGRGRA